LSNSTIVTKLASQRPQVGLKLNYQETVKKWDPWLKYKSLKKKQRIGLNLLASNVLILLVIIFFIVIVPQENTLKSDSISSPGHISSAVYNPLNQLASAKIALTISQAADLPEQTPISNQAESQQAELSQASTTDNVISEPQVLTTNLKSRQDIFSYTTQPGDTVSSLAVKFGITSNSIMWSNNLNSNALTPGLKLTIPPVTGVAYTVKSGDTIASIAQKYSSSQAQLIAYNDAEIGGIQAGEKILIPNGSVAQNVAPTWSGAVYGFNGYDYGYCTWYVASQVSVPSNWGNASSWSYYAALSGWNVSSAPKVGAIAQTPYAAGGEGHVAMVVGVNGNQVEIRDMNNYGDGGGWGRVGSAWVDASTFPNYLSH
jgi:surface antigen